jgi:hypothetical protein
VGARAAVDQAVTENHRAVIDDFRGLVGLQLAEPAVGIDDTALFGQFSAPVARIVNVYAPSTRLFYVSIFSDFIDMF